MEAIYISDEQLDLNCLHYGLDTDEVWTILVLYNDGAKISWNM